jgi:WD40 repeat protein
VYELKSGTQLVEVKTLDERDFITAIRYSGTDEYLAVADNAKNVKCYRMSGDLQFADVTNGMWQHHAGRVTSIAWSPDSSRLATSSVDTHCIVYSPVRVNEVMQIKNAHPLNPLLACAWLDERQLVTASQDCCLRKWKLNV